MTTTVITSQNPQTQLFETLEKLLQACNWREASLETETILTKAAGRENLQQVTDVAEFPVKVLQTIDKLWVNYSQGRFGFSPQQRIYRNLGGKKEYEESSWKTFCEKICWRKNNTYVPFEQMQFNLAAPVGHFPAISSLGTNSQPCTVCGGECVQLRCIISTIDFQ
ncbi:MAG: GUN4 domain-containing protein [Oscillatoria sp. PMC 1068.18]|nr:GUN4 domain-containing protein [Oscillatoria sp. PMC 1076.18]MEC4987997.1 GUN4 domain-containing protein [Oscillatoria sp. PMC 1068.18]